MGERVIGLRKSIDHRHPGRSHVEHTAGIDATGGDHDSVDPLLKERLDVQHLPFRIVCGIAHEDRDAAVGEVLLQPLHDGDAKAAEIVVGDEPNGEGLAAMQALRQVVRLEADRLRHLDHALACFLAQLAVIVQRFGYCAD
jgi:hypothetical protein